jgi:hypothetical protein
MATPRTWSLLAAVTIALGAASGGLAPSAGLAQDTVPQGHLHSPSFMPLGHAYAPGEEALPAIDSARSRFESQVDILQTEVYRRNYEQRMFESEMNRHDLRGGPLDSPRY